MYPSGLEATRRPDLRLVILRPRLTYISTDMANSLAFVPVCACVCLCVCACVVFVCEFLFALCYIMCLCFMPGSCCCC